MIAATHPLDRRVRLTNATVRHFQGRAFRWGACDCARIAAWHLRQFGHSPQIAKAGSYKSALGAAAALKRMGYATLADAIDATGLPRITPAEAWVGDLVMGDSGDVFGALGIYLGNGAMLGFHEDAPGAVILRRVHLSTGWRVE